METFLDILLNALTLSLVIIPLFNDLMLHKETHPNKSFFQRITSAGKWVIAIAIISIGLVWLKDYAVYRNNKKDRRDLINEIDNHFDAKLDKFNLKYDSTTGEIVNKRDSQLINETAKRVVTNQSNKKEQGIISICRESTMFPGNEPSFFRVRIPVCNIGKGIIYNIKDETKVVLIREGKISTIGQISSSMLNKEYVLEPNGIITMQSRFDRPTLFEGDRYYLCFKFEYDDSVKKNNKYVGILMATNISLNGLLAVPPSDNYNEVKTFLNW